MNFDLHSIAMAFLAGAALGVGYLALLWESLQGLATAQNPLARILGGAVLRMAALLGLFFLVMDGQGERLLACLAGFMIARVLVVWVTGMAAVTAPTR